MLCEFSLGIRPLSMTPISKLRDVLEKVRTRGNIILTKINVIEPVQMILAETSTIRAIFNHMLTFL